MFHLKEHVYPQKVCHVSLLANNIAEIIDTITCCHFHVRNSQLYLQGNSAGSQEDEVC